MRMNLHCELFRLLPTLIGLVSVLLGAHQLASAQTVAYTHATVETLSSHGRLENATILVRSGKIVDVGVDVKIPDEARVVSLMGQTVMPGIIEPYLVYKRTAVSSEETETVTFGGRSFQIPTTRAFNPGSFDTISEYFYPYSFDFLRYVRAGVATVNLVSDGRGLSAFADMTVEPSADMLFESNGLLFARLTNETASIDVIRNPLNPRPTRGAPPTGQTRPGAAATGRPAGAEASASGQGQEQTPQSGGATNANEAQWAEVREGKRALIVNANNAAAVAHLVRILSNQPKVKVVLVVTGPNVYEALDQIKGTNISLVLKPEIATEPFSARRTNVAKMAADRNIPFAFSLTVGANQLENTWDEPLFPVASLVKTGLSRELALAALTSTPAKMLGIENNYGTIEAGKYANLLIFQGDPLTTGSRLKQVIVKGSSIYAN